MDVDQWLLWAAWALDNKRMRDTAREVARQDAARLNAKRAEQ